MNNPQSVGNSVTVETLDNCPVCGSYSIISWCEGRDRLHEKIAEQFEYSRCSSCGVVFESLRPLEDEVHKAYPVDYGPHQKSKKAPSKPKTVTRAVYVLAAHIVGHRAFQEILNTMLMTFDEGDVVLDYGCGSGKFLNVMSNRGCRTIGIDFSSQAIKTVQSNGHEGYLVDENTWDYIEDNSVDFIRMNHVVEHLYHPREILGKLFRKLKKGGRIHIAVPNPAGFTAKMFRSMWHGLDCPRHIILYPPKTLSEMLVEIGFQDTKIYPEPLTKDHIRSWGYLLHKLGLLPHHKIDSLMYSAILQLLTAVPCRILSLIGMADRYHIVALKP